jgi:CHAD domain-containing protein
LLNLDMPAALAPVAAFTGRLREYKLHMAGAPARLAVLEGTVRGVTQDRASCHVIVTGQAAAAGALASALSDVVRLTVPRAGLAAQAMAVARGQVPAARRTGAPSIPPGTTVAEALACVVTHLADVILHWASLVPGAATPEPVHQMRVAVRRLRSALSVFRRAAQDEGGACAWLDELAGQLKSLASQLGQARDWDVFIVGTGEDVAGAFPKDRRIAQLNAGAARKREAAYAELASFFASRTWAKLEITLALLPTLRPWGEGSQPGGSFRLALPIRDYAADSLKRRLKSVLTYGDDLSAHDPAELHELRKQAKRLRYATEFFAPLFPDKPVRRYLPRLEDLQEELGALNDRTVAAALMEQLGGGADRAFAAGVVMGFGAASSARAAARIQRAWDKFIQARPFWTRE